MKYSRNHSIAIVFILCVAYLIWSDNGWIINKDFFEQINILEGRAGYVVTFQSLFHILSVVWQQKFLGLLVYSLFSE